MPPRPPCRHSCLFATAVGSRAALLVAGNPLKTDPATAPARHHSASARHGSGYPGADTATAAASSLHPAPPPPASGLQGMISATETPFFSTKNDVFAAERVFL